MRTEVSLVDYPFVLRLEADGHPFSGVVLHRSWILTAAHCLVAPDGRVRDLHTARHGQPGTAYPYHERKFFWQPVPHPDYDYAGAGFRYDVCLIRTNEPFERIPRARPTTLDHEEYRATTGREAVSVGYGMRSESFYPLRACEAPLLTAADYAKRPGSEPEDPVVNETAVCISGPENRLRPGDAGGPLLLREPQTYVQIGIASHYDVQRQVSVFQRVGLVHDWILATTGLRELNFR